MSSAYSFYFLAFSCFLAISVHSTPVNKCTSTIAPLPEVEILNCDTPPCVFIIGQSGVMSMSFRAPRYLEHFQPNAMASVMGLNVSYPLNQNDGCVGVTNTPCPLAKGEHVEYTYAMEILPIFPAVGLTLEFSLIDLDADKEAFVCFKVDLKLSS